MIITNSIVLDFIVRDEPSHSAFVTFALTVKVDARAAKAYLVDSTAIVDSVCEVQTVTAVSIKVLAAKIDEIPT